jgi:predicted alpha/beta hydrolase family esterase
VVEGFLVRWLSENQNIRCRKVILVAPWIDPEREFDTTDFFDFEIDPKIAVRVKKFVVYSSTNDDNRIQASIKIIRKEIPDHTYREFENVGHFASFKNHEFPELLEELAG